MYAPNPSGGIALNPAFVAFFNRAAAFSDTLYPGGSATPRLSYALRATAPQGVQSLTLTVGRQSLTVNRGRQTTMGFVWPGDSAQEIRLTGKFGGGPDLTFNSYDGLWAPFEFFGDADRWQTISIVRDNFDLVFTVRDMALAEPLFAQAPGSVRPVDQQTIACGTNWT